ncbi:hypothetical protein [Nesterenkonia sp. HG001]|uniref:hypothetical protein n=1 Tax=Nesterenkonia sp. HG001 TaxID=2983207 RepID=UPI002AC485B8|nr:hypothetical protein [Nesterenkonia sp. HG001]MDZ5077616.1 hypothetical protein [Nesterenkonia sp. HG001]
MDPSSLKPTITGPLVPARTHPGSFTTQVTGGPTWTEVFWETLMESAAHLSRAREISDTQSADIAANNTLLMTPLASAPHWRIPLLGVRGVVLASRIVLVGEMVQAYLHGVQACHDAYRDAESLVRRWLQLARLLEETPYVVGQGVQGDTGLVGDWARSVGVLGGREAMRVLMLTLSRGRSGLGGAGRQGLGKAWDRASSTGFLAIEALKENDGLSTYEMDRHLLELRGETGRFIHEGDGTLHSWYAQMQEVPSQGDLAVTSVADDDGGTTYLVHLPGLDMDVTDMNREDGRGYLGLVDAVFNDAEQVSEAVDQALQAVGAEEGDAVALSGYSLGGIGASNVVRNGRLGQKYDLLAATSLGAPGQQGSYPPGTQTSTTHIQDRRDPVPHILGEHQGTGANRQVIDVAHHNEDLDLEGLSLFGDAHSYEHYLDIVEELEADPQEHLGEDGDTLLRDFAELYDGEAETVVFETGWKEDPDHEVHHPFQKEFWEEPDLEEIMQESLDGLGMSRIGDVFGPLTPVDSPATAEAGSTGKAPEATAAEGAHEVRAPLAQETTTAQESAAGQEERPGREAQPLSPGLLGPRVRGPGHPELDIPNLDIPNLDTPGVPWAEVEMPVHVHGAQSR